MIFSGGVTHGRGILWVQRTSFWDQGFRINCEGLAASRDLTRLATINTKTNRIRTSSDGGLSWTDSEHTNLAITRGGIAASDDLTKLVASTEFGSRTWLSRDSGSAWTELARPYTTGNFGQQDRTGAAASSDFTKLLLTASPGNLWTTNNSTRLGEGAWIEHNTTGPPRDWRGATASPDFTKLAAVVHNGNIWMSGDAGVTWTENIASPGANKTWIDIAASQDFTKLLAVTNLGKGWTSNDSGVTWTENTAVFSQERTWRGVAVSSDFTKLALIDLNCDFFTPAKAADSSDMDTSVIVAIVFVCAAFAGLAVHVCWKRTPPVHTAPDVAMAVATSPDTLPEASVPNPAMAKLDLGVPGESTGHQQRHVAALPDAPGACGSPAEVPDAGNTMDFTSFMTSLLSVMLLSLVSFTGSDHVKYIDTSVTPDESCQNPTCGSSCFTLNPSESNVSCEKESWTGHQLIYPSIVIVVVGVLMLFRLVSIDVCERKVFSTLPAALCILGVSALFSGLNAEFLSLENVQLSDYMIQWAFFNVFSVMGLLSHLAERRWLQLYIRFVMVVAGAMLGLLVLVREALTRTTCGQPGVRDLVCHIEGFRTTGTKISIYMCGLLSVLLAILGAVMQFKMDEQRSIAFFKTRALFCGMVAGVVFWYCVGWTTYYFSAGGFDSSEQQEQVARVFQHTASSTLSLCVSLWLFRTDAQKNDVDGEEDSTDDQDAPDLKEDFDGEDGLEE
eukprot:TRINITY_DN38764_c0_g1_i1.p1 TRINITY_DN38764_c0_g1~~TRINITY_DN38764_c0_g1_i1.p1  ORF type:complete len:730 (-),score=84.89 TRINITY_DN38764_c0_g1_i1:129-2318(-)